ncbi:unnamed protein product [Effrenium voratum]|nr:unnamed protein product [Effrenium voratum]
MELGRQHLRGFSLGASLVAAALFLLREPSLRQAFPGAAPELQKIPMASPEPTASEGDEQEGTESFTASTSTPEGGNDLGPTAGGSPVTPEPELQPRQPEQSPLKAASKHRCGAEFMTAPCDMFSFIDHDMKKWGDRSIHNGQVRLADKQDKNQALLGSFHGRLYLVYKQNVRKDLEFGAFWKTLQLLSAVAESHPLDTEFLVHSSDVPVEPRANPAHRCDQAERCVFSTSSGPRFCDLSLPPGVRPFLTAEGEGGDVAYAEKRNLGFWRGSIWPARRCTNDWRSPRVLMCQESLKHPEVLNASLGGLDCGRKEPPELCKLIHSWRPHRVPFDEQLKYRFLLTSTPACTYTGRVSRFLNSNSVVAMFSNGKEAVGQVLHAAFEEDVHFKYVHAGSFVEEVRQMQRDWEKLEELSVNARRKWSWATHHETVTCYMYELLTRYTRKLAYVPSTHGTIQALLHHSAPADTLAKPWVEGAEIRASGRARRPRWPEIGRATALMCAPGCRPELRCRSKSASP